MRKHAKIFIAVLAIVLLAAGCNQAQPQTNNKPLPEQNQQPISTDSSITPIGHTQTRDNPNGPDFFPNGQKPGDVVKPDYKPGFIIVTQTVAGSNINEPYTQILKSATVRDLLTVTHKVDFKNYGSLGDFVTGIDGKTADSKHFWEFFINGKSSNVGASSYVLKNGDNIEWKLSAISSSGD